MATCAETTYETPYLEYAISLPLVILLQFLLLSNSIYHEYSEHNNNIALITRILYIILQLIGISWTLMDFFRLVIDPHSPILRDNIGCDITSWASKLIPLIYYAIYLHQILIRLKVSFQNSFFQLNKTIVYILTALLYFISISLSLILILNTNPACKVAWNPADFPDEHLECCSIILSSNLQPILMAGVLFVAFFNILLGSIFTVKLKKLLSYTADQHNDIKFKFKWLIVKNCLLTLTGATSTLIAWSFWVLKPFGIGTMFLYFDLLINVLVIALMIKYNEKYYKITCKCCIILCLRDCDKTKNKEDEAHILKYIRFVSVEMDKGSDDEHGKKVDTLSSNTNVTMKRDKITTLTGGTGKEDIDLYSGTEIEIIAKSNTNTQMNEKQPIGETIKTNSN
eukprot:153473_1